MKTRPKDLGTREETATVRLAVSKGLVAERLPEGASADRGDVRVYAEHEWIGEVKNRQALNIHAALEKAILKAGTVDTFVVWRRMVRHAGNTNRTQEGPVVVVLTLDRFFVLLAASVGVEP
jgi:hypothetical protein